MNWEQYFDYDKKRGELVWKDRPREHFSTERGWKVFRTRFLGKAASTEHSRGYRQVIISSPDGLSRNLFLAHRIIWEMHNGPIPSGLDIDHIDRDRANNKIENLRLATRSQNLQNSDYHRGYNGLAGVSFDKRRKKKPYYSRVRVGEKVIQLGRFKTAEEAHAAWNKAVADIRGEWAVRPSKPQ